MTFGGHIKLEASGSSMRRDDRAVEDGILGSWSEALFRFVDGDVYPLDGRFIGGKELQMGSHSR